MTTEFWHVILTWYYTSKYNSSFDQNNNPHLKIIYGKGGATITENEHFIDSATYPEQLGQHIFDDAFLSVCVWEKRLLIPLINEVFGLDIPENAEIIDKPRESYAESAKDHLIKRVTDALIRVDNGVYHFECESKNDGSILMRVAEYDTRIAINDASYEDYKVNINLPNSAVVFVRNHRKLPIAGEIEYRLNDQVIKDIVPFIKVARYELDYLIERHLFILLPFYLIRYEHALMNNTQSKENLIESEVCRVYNELTRVYDANILTKRTYEKIMSLCNHVLKHISRNNENRERLMEVMGTGVLLSYEDIGEHNGRIKGRAEGRAEGRIDALLDSLRAVMKNGSMSFKEACKLLDINDPDKYRNLI